MFYLKLTDNRGKELPSYNHEGKRWYEVRPGQEFRVEIEPRGYGWARREYVVSVDGVDVISGKKASQHNRGLIAPLDVVVKGWRTSMNNVMAFVATYSKLSYAYKSGLGGNEGVVAVAVWSEKEDDKQEVVYRGMTRSMSAGTDAGRDLNDNVGITTFERDKLIFSDSVRYAFRDELVERGILLGDVPDGPPNPWPADGFCKRR
jgi:hypothetical protein